MNKLETLSTKRLKQYPLERIGLRAFVDEKRSYHYFKRFFDLAFSAIFLIFIASWLFPVIALLIRIDSKGPIFFIQKRVGKGGHAFRCFKFRSMVVNQEANNRQAEENDIRITRFGKFLRNSSLDELPQFVNVLLGDMSIVGPRPHMHADCKRFSNIIAGYKFRNFIKPGITGLAQVKGFRGPTKNFESIFHRFQYDAFYVRNCNFWLDMRIIRQTAAQTFHFILLKFAGKEKETSPNDQLVSLEMS